MAVARRVVEPLVWLAALGLIAVGAEEEWNASATTTTSTATTTTASTFLASTRTHTTSTGTTSMDITTTDTTTTDTTTTVTTDTVTATTTDNGERCDGSTSISFSPQSITAMSRGKITFSRGCEAESCCFNGVCGKSTPQIDNGQTVCYTPLLGNVDEAQVSLKMPSTEVLGAEPLKVDRAFGNFWWSESWLYSYVYEQWRWSRDSAGRWTFELTGKYRMCQYSWGLSSSCCHLVAIGMELQVLELNVKWCSTSRWGCSSVGEPWKDEEVKELLKDFPLRGLAVRCESEQLPDEEFFFPAAILRQFQFNRLDYISDWARKDSQNLRVAPAIKQIAASYRCPAHTGLSPRPRQLWPSWNADKSWAEVGVSSCLDSWLTWWGGVDGGVRCCYDAEGIYVQEWPSRVLFYNSKMSTWSWREETEVEQVTCAADPLSEACQIYRSRRPPIPTTNNLYGEGSRWELPRPFGGGWGDPHCKSIDGLEFECNFRGEAVWAGCGSWTVHAIAEQLGASNATIITKIAVRYGAETLVARLNASVSMEVDNETGLAPTRYTLLLNGSEPVGDSDGDASGNYLTATGFNNELTIEDASGNVVKASFLKDLIVLQVNPTDGCFNKTFGLSGNNNADTSDDLTVNGTGEVLPTDSSSSDIFQKFVMSYVITEESESFFPAEDFVPVNDSFTPTFIDQLDLSECPSACNGNGACCLDASQGGEEFVEAFTVATKEIKETNVEAVGFYDNLRPAFEEGPSLYVLQQGGGADRNRLRFVATDVDGIDALSCSICPGEDAVYAFTHDVTCDVSGVGTNSSVITVKFSSLDYGSFSCFTKDTLGANATSVTLVVKEDKTTSERVWALEEELGAGRTVTETETETTSETATTTEEEQQRSPSNLAARPARASLPLLWGCAALMAATAAALPGGLAAGAE